MTTTKHLKNFDAIEVDMQRMQMALPSEKVMIKTPNAEALLKEGLAYFLAKENRALQWLPEYRHVARWLSDNEGRGLFMYGNCGRGKSLLCRYVLPAILLGYHRRVVSVFDTNEMNSRIDYMLSRNIISLDDIGTEEVSVVYGNRRMAFAEVMDAAEKYGKLIIVSTNLTVSEIRKRYGDRVLDRIKSTTARVLFEGESMRC